MMKFVIVLTVALIAVQYGAAAGIGNGVGQTRDFSETQEKYQNLMDKAWGIMEKLENVFREFENGLNTVTSTINVTEFIGNLHRLINEHLGSFTSACADKANERSLKFSKDINLKVDNCVKNTVPVMENINNTIFADLHEISGIHIDLGLSEMSCAIKHTNIEEIEKCLKHEIKHNENKVDTLEVQATKSAETASKLSVEGLSELEDCMENVKAFAEKETKHIISKLDKCLNEQ